MGVLQLILATTGEKITAALHLNKEIVNSSQSEQLEL